MFNKRLIKVLVISPGKIVQPLMYPRGIVFRRNQCPALWKGMCPRSNRLPPKRSKRRRTTLMYQYIRKKSLWRHWHKTWGTTRPTARLCPTVTISSTHWKPHSTWWQTWAATLFFNKKITRLSWVLPPEPQLFKSPKRPGRSKSQG